MKIQIIDGTSIKSDNAIRKGSGIHGAGTVTRSWNRPSEFVAPEKAMCRGCRDDFYNGHGAKECWMFKKSTVVNKVGYSSLHVMNGPDTHMVRTLDCWHGVRK